MRRWQSIDVCFQTRFGSRRAVLDLGGIPAASLGDVLEIIQVLLDLRGLALERAVPAHRVVGRSRQRVRLRNGGRAAQRAGRRLE